MYTNTKTLPTDFFYYVYAHVNPLSDEIVYIGMGQKGRAWAITNSGKDSSAYGHRSKPHYEWFENLEKQGFTLEDIVCILEKGMSKKDACSLEKELIEENNPIFNKTQGLKNLKVTPEAFEVMKTLREEGFYYREIAETLGLSQMTVYRALNNQTKNLGETNV